MPSDNSRTRRNGTIMTISPSMILIIVGFLILSLAPPAGAQVPEWRISLSNDSISSIALSSTGDHIVIGSSKGEVHLFSQNGTDVWFEAFPGDQLVKISGDSSRIFAGSREDLYTNKGALRILYPNGTLLSKTVTGWIADLALADKTGQFVVGTTGGKVFLFNQDGDVSTINDFFLSYHPIASIAISADGSTIPYSVWIDQDPLFIINRKNTNRQNIMPNVIDLITVSSNGTDIATSEGEGSIGMISSWNLNGKARWTTKTPRVNYLKISDDGSLVVGGAEDGSVFSLNNSGDILWNYPTDGKITALSINSQATKIVAGTTNGTLYLFDNTGNIIWKYNDGSIFNTQITALEISRDGSSIIASINRRELLYFLTSEYLPDPLVQSSTTNISTMRVDVNDTDHDLNNTYTQEPLNFSTLLSGNSEIYSIIQNILRNFGSVKEGDDYRGDVSSRITMVPLLIFTSGHTFNGTLNLPTTLIRSDNTADNNFNNTTATNTSSTIPASKNTDDNSNNTTATKTSGNLPALNNTDDNSNNTTAAKTSGNLPALNNTDDNSNNFIIYIHHKPLSD